MQSGIRMGGCQVPGLCVAPPALCQIHLFITIIIIVYPPLHLSCSTIIFIIIITRITKCSMLLYLTRYPTDHHHHCDHCDLCKKEGAVLYCCKTTGSCLTWAPPSPWIWTGFAPNTQTVFLYLLTLHLCSPRTSVFTHYAHNGAHQVIAHIAFVNMDFQLCSTKLYIHSLTHWQG